MSGALHWTNLIDVTFITDHNPTGTRSMSPRPCCFRSAANAVTAAFCCAKLGIVALTLIAHLSPRPAGAYFRI